MVLADRFEVDFDLPPSVPNLGVYKVISHLLQILFALLTLCVTAPIIQAERKYYDASQGNPNFTLFVTLQTIFIAAALAYFPLSQISEKGEVGCYVTIRRFFLRPRSRLIFSIYMAICWFIAMIAMTAHTTRPSNCALDSELLENDDSYEGIWNNQCRCAKASAAFSWISFFISVVPVVISGILLWHEKKMIHAEPKPTRDGEDEISEKAASTDNSSSNSTIVDMDYSEKDKEPALSDYQFSSPIGTHVNTPHTASSPAPPSLPSHGTPLSHSSSQLRSYTPSLASQYMHQDSPLQMTSPPPPPLHTQYPSYPSQRSTPVMSTLTTPYPPKVMADSHTMISSPLSSQHYPSFVQSPPPPSSAPHGTPMSFVPSAGPQAPMPMQYTYTNSSSTVNSPYQQMVPPTLTSYMSPPPSAFSHSPSQPYYIPHQQPSYHRP